MIIQVGPQTPDKALFFGPIGSPFHRCKQVGKLLDQQAQQVTLSQQKQNQKENECENETDRNKIIPTWVWMQPELTGNQSKFNPQSMPNVARKIS